MFSKTGERRIRSAAWRVSIWSGLAFALGTAGAFWFLQNFMATDLQNRADSWLTGELGVLADIAERTPGDKLHDALVVEVAELASREAPHDSDSADVASHGVFFVQTSPDGSLKLHTGVGTARTDLDAIGGKNIQPGQPQDVAVPGFLFPFRVAATDLPGGDRIYLALSSRYEHQMLERLSRDFAALWFGVIALGTLIVFVSTRRMLHRVQMISETASGIGQSNLSSRVPVGKRNDEVSQLASTLNRMLDRIEAAIQQLHTMSDSLTHDLRSPLTSIRGRLELALMSEDPGAKEDAIISSLEQLDRLSMLLSTSLDVSEANADALRLRKESIDLEATVRSMVELYEPSFSQAGLRLQVRGKGPVWVQADAALLQRTMTNLFDNELKHLQSGTTVTVTVDQSDRGSVLVLEDDGTGFPAEVLPRVFEKYVKGAASDGHGLGLAFVAAVVRSHNGSVAARNRNEGGARIAIELP